MGKGRKGKRNRAAVATIAVPVAQRHGFDDGILGHDLTYSVNVTEHSALSVDSVLACVRTIADLTADAVVGEYRGTTRLDEESRIVRRPMASITRRTWIWMVAATMALYNGCYLWSRFGKDSERIAVTLQPVAPSRVQWMNARTVHIDGVEVNPDDLRWIPRMTFPTLTRELGSLIHLAREAFAAALAADLNRSGFWETGGAVGVYITSDQDINTESAEDIADRYVTRRAANPGRPPVFSKGAELKSLGADHVSEGASKALGTIGTAIARYFGVPAWLVNVPQEAGSLVYANASAAGLDLVRYTLQPG